MEMIKEIITKLCVHLITWNDHFSNYKFISEHRCRLQASTFLLVTLSYGVIWPLRSRRTATLSSWKFQLFRLAIAKTIEPLRLDLYDRHIWNSKFLIFVNQIFFNSKTISLWKLTFTVRKLTVKIADYLSQPPRCFIRGPVKLRGLFYVESLQFSNA